MRMSSKKKDIYIYIYKKKYPYSPFENPLWPVIFKIPLVLLLWFRWTKNIERSKKKAASGRVTCKAEVSFVFIFVYWLPKLKGKCEWYGIKQVEGIVN
jgi:hypothetical protein